MEYAKWDELLENCDVKQQPWIKAAKGQSQHFFDLMEKKFTEEWQKLKCKEKFGRIITTLLPDPAKVDGLFPVIPKESLLNLANVESNVEKLKLSPKGFVGKVFLQCSFSKFIEFADSSKKYEAVLLFADGKKKYVHYQLIFSESIVEEERKLLRFAESYGVEQPLVFSPYGRRIVDVVFDTDEYTVNKDKISSIDFQLESNGLKEFFIQDKNLYWNIEIKPDEHDHLPEPEHICVTGDGEYYYYALQLGKDQFLLPNAVQDLCLKIRRCEDFVEVLSRNRLVDTPATLLKVHSIQDRVLFREYFGNVHLSVDVVDYASNLSRIRTFGDAELVVRNFGEQFGIKFDSVSIEKEDYIVINEPEIRFNLYHSDLPWRGSKIYLRYSVKEKSDFIEDYILFVTGYLNYCYPEIKWIGAYK